MFKFLILKRFNYINKIFIIFIRENNNKDINNAFYVKRGGTPPNGEGEGGVPRGVIFLVNISLYILLILYVKLLITAKYL